MQIPVISRSLGKRLFKRYLELFFDPLFYSIVSKQTVKKACTATVYAKID